MLRASGLMAVVLLVTTFAGTVPAYAAATGSIGGTITNGGVPAAGVQVQIIGNGEFSGAAETDEAGRYEVTDVPAATLTYKVRIDKDGHPGQYAHGKLDWSQAEYFSVASGRRTTVNDALLPSGTITGRFTDTSGNGVTARVFAEGTAAHVYASGQTDTDGYFSFQAVPDTYRIRFTHGLASQYAYGAVDRDRAATFRVTAGGTVTVNEVKMREGSVAGRVTNADGTPASGVTVEARGDSYSPGPTTVTDKAGRYRIDNLLPGRYRFAFQLPSGSTQWAPRTHLAEQARTFAVLGDTGTTVNERLLPIGVIRGRFTDRDGAPMPGVTATAFPEGREYHPDTFLVETTTDADGRYRFAVFAGTYQVRFHNYEIGLRQYAHGRMTTETADRITVPGGRTSTVNDRWLPTGGVRFTARDSLTGAAVEHFSVYLLDQVGYTENGAAVLSEVPAGTYPVGVYASGYGFVEKAGTVTVVGGRQVDVRLSLRPVGRITTTVTDRATGAPVAGICVFPVGTHFYRPYEYPADCPTRSDETGVVTIEVSNPGTYRLFVLPRYDSPYGAQWVGRGGGTGTQTEALPVTVAAGRTTSVQKIRLDPPGIITGRVSSKTGASVWTSRVSYFGVSPDTGVAQQLSATVAADGVYTIRGLGPYRWPLLFHADAHPYQWSGGVGNRVKAELIRVRSGKVTTYHHTLRQGADVTLSLPSGTGHCDVLIFNATTGDLLEIAYILRPPSQDRLPVIGPQMVKLKAICGTDTVWHGGTDFASAKPERIPARGSVHIRMLGG